MSKNLLLLSSSRVANTDYLEHALPLIDSFIGLSSYNAKPLIFIPFAGVSVGYDQYESMVQKAFDSIGLTINSIHNFDNPAQAVADSGGIVTGGGNTFALLNSLYQNNLLQSIKQQVTNGLPYIGWSAGSNIAGPTICTTNDMPIIEPPSFKALDLIEWQLNPHYIDGNPPGHNGETREQRLQEFLVLNPQAKVIGIPEGTALQLNGKVLSYLGDRTGYLFRQQGKQEFTNSEQLNQLLLS